MDILSSCEIISWIRGLPSEIYTMEKKSQSLIIPVIVIGVCLIAFGIPLLFSVGVDDTHDDIVLAPRFTPTPTPLDRALTQQAFADLFFSPTAPLVLTNTPFSTSTAQLAAAILITGPTSSSTPTITASPTASRTPISIFPTRTQSDPNNPIPTPTNLPTNTATKIPPTNTPIVVVTNTSSPLPPTNTSTSIPPTLTSAPPTLTPVPPTATSAPPTATDVPPTDIPPTDPPSTDTLEPGGNTTSDTFGSNLFFLFPMALVLFPAFLLRRLTGI